MSPPGYLYKMSFYVKTVNNQIMAPFDRPHTSFYYSSIATMSLSCTVSEILSLISQIPT